MVLFPLHHPILIYFFKKIENLGGGYGNFFIGGALDYGSSVRQFWTEAGDVWDGSLDNRTVSIVSISAGKATVEEFCLGVSDLVERLQAVSTENGTTAGQFYNGHRYELVQSQPYYHFKVKKSLGKIGLLEETIEKSLIISATKEYPKSVETIDKIESCSERLAARECAPSLI